MRFYGDKSKADAVYKGVEPLTPDDIAEVVVFAAGRRENVVLADSLIFPNHQVSPTTTLFLPHVHTCRAPFWFQIRDDPTRDVSARISQIGAGRLTLVGCLGCRDCHAPKIVTQGFNVRASAPKENTPSELK